MSYSTLKRWLMFALFCSIQCQVYHCQASDYTVSGDVTISEPQYDFGRLPQNKKFSHVFALTNNTREAISIRGVSASCSCTSTILSEKLIAPGKHAQVKITLNTKGLHGHTRKSCVVLFENVEQPPIKIDITAFVYVPSADFAISSVHFDNVLVGKQRTMNIKLVNNDDKQAKWQITKVKTSSPIIIAKYRPNYGDISCTLSGDAPIGSIKEKVIVTAQEKKDIVEIEIPVLGQVIGPLTVVPKRMFLGALEQDQSYEGTFTIQSLWEDVSLSVLSLPANCAVTLGKLENKTYFCNFKIRTTTTSGLLKGNIIVKTNIAKQPLLEIPFAGFVVKKRTAPASLARETSVRSQTAVP